MGYAKCVAVLKVIGCSSAMRTAHDVESSVSLQDNLTQETEGGTVELHLLLASAMLIASTAFLDWRLMHAQWRNTPITFTETWGVEFDRRN